MPQYDFGVIDPDVRDGAWLADALNQWRDAIYSQMSGAAAPAFAVPGFIWRDTAAGSAGAVMRQFEAGAWRELWRFDSTGKVRFANTFDSTGGNIDGFVWFKATPDSFRTDGNVGIGAAPEPGGWARLTVRAGGDCGVLFATTSASVAYLRQATPTTDIAWSAGGTSNYFYVWDYKTGYTPFAITTACCFVARRLGVGTIDPQQPLHVYDATGWATILAQAATAGQGAQIGLQTVERFFTVRNFGGTFGVFDVTTGATRLSCTPNGEWQIHPRGDGWGSLFVGGTTSGGIVYVASNSRTWRMDTRTVGAAFYIRDDTAGVDRFWCNPDGGVGVGADFWAAGALRGGPGDAGRLRCWGTANLVCFRWDGTTLRYRVDEVNDLPVGSTVNMGTITYIDLVSSGLGSFGWVMTANQAAGGVGGYWVPDAVSDPSLKANMRPATVDALAVIRRVDLVEYDFIPAGGAHVPLGFNAGTLQHQIPDMVYHPPNAPMVLNARGGVPWLFRAVQQLDGRLAALEERSRQWQP